MTSSTGSHGFEHALVIGASMTGLLAARVLSEHFREVTIVERDELVDAPDIRKGVPQGRHAHALLCRGQQVMEQLFPGLFDDLIARGAHRIDMGAQCGWVHFGKWKIRHHSGLTSYYQSRPLLEWCVRSRVTALPNVHFVRGDAAELLPSANGDGVNGALIRLRGRADADATAQLGTLKADLIIDASGRGSRTPRWLEQLGYAQPRTTAVRIDAGYGTRVYRRAANVPADRQVVILYPDPPRTKRAGFMIPIEGDRWLVTIGGRFCDYAPEDEAGYLEYARSLSAPDIYETIRNAEPLTDIISNRFKENLWRHYERLERAPEGLVVLGDALCSYNPAYGQGMTASALEALALDECLREHRANGAHNTRGLARKVQRRAGEIVKMPWMLATSEDFRYPQTIGERPLGMRALHWYTRKIHERSADSAYIYRAFLHVMQMMEPPASLFRPGVIARLLWKPRSKPSQVRSVGTTALPAEVER